MMGVQHKVVGVGFGLATAIYATQGLGDPVGVWALATATVGCMLPDIDHDRSKIGRKRKFVVDLSGKVLTAITVGAIILGAIIIGFMFVGMKESDTNVDTLLTGIAGIIAFAILRKVVTNNKTFKWMAHHRGLMHTLIPPVILLVLCFVSDYPVWRWTFIGLFIGYLSHLIADMLTVEGCPILWPITTNNIRILKLKTKNASTWLAAVGLAALPVVLVYFSLGGHF